MKGLAPGRIVHYLNHAAAHVPAIVTEIGETPQGGFCQLYILDSHGPFFHWAYYSEQPEVNTWHWIEPA